MASKQTKIMSDEEYVATGGNRCPKCKSTNVSGGQVEVDASIAWQPVTCSDCGAEWNDTYKLTGFSEFCADS